MFFTNKVSRYHIILVSCQSSEITKLGYYIGIYYIRKRSNNNSSNSILINHSCETKIDYGGVQICKILQLYDFFNSSKEWIISNIWIGNNEAVGKV